MISTLLLLLAPAASALTPQIHHETDVVVLKDGKELEGRVLYDGPDGVVLRQGRKNRDIGAQDVAEVRSVERSMREFLDRFDGTRRDDVAALTALAEFCEQNELLGEARSLWIRVLTVDAENETAWTRLGGVKGRKGWRLRVRGRFYTLEQLRDRASDWKNALELPTAHFLLRTDIEPQRALDITIDLERAYQAYYELFGQPMRLYAFDDVPEIHVYRHSEDFPTPPLIGSPVWYSAIANTLHVDSSAGASPSQIVAELTHGLLFNSLRRSLGRSGNLEPWARRGISTQFGSAVRARPGKATWDVGQPYRPYFEAQAADEAPLTIKEVVRAARGAFTTGREMDRYEAHSYTLTHFLLHAQDGRHRQGFADYIRSSFQGKGSTSHLEKCLDVDLDELEAEWRAYVHEVAGS